MKNNHPTWLDAPCSIRLSEPILNVTDITYERDYMADYPKPSVTADILVKDEESGKLLLIKRAKDPYKDTWAFPGGFMDVDKQETMVEAAARELQEETGIILPINKLLFITYADKPDRDPRGRVIAFVFLAVIKASEHMIKAADDAKEIGWFKMGSLPPMAFDHQDIWSQVIKIIINRATNERSDTT